MIHYVPQLPKGGAGVIAKITEFRNKRSEARNKAN
jgi:hypothetical protein